MNRYKIMAGLHLLHLPEYENFLSLVSSEGDYCFIIKKYKEVNNEWEKIDSYIEMVSTGRKISLMPKTYDKPATIDEVKWNDKDEIIMKKWSLFQRMGYWFIQAGREKLLQRLLIPYHFIYGVICRYRLKDILEFCGCSWRNETYPFKDRRPDLRRWWNGTYKFSRK